MAANRLGGDSMNETGTSELRIFADTSDIVPFWARLPRFFLYPLRLGSLALPGSRMSLVVSDSLLEAINPRTLVFIIGQIGWPYVLLCFFLFMLSGSSFAAFFLIGHWLSPWLFLPVFLGLQIYFGLVMF